MLTHGILIMIIKWDYKMTPPAQRPFVEQPITFFIHLSRFLYYMWHSYTWVPFCLKSLFYWSVHFCTPIFSAPKPLLRQSHHLGRTLTWLEVAFSCITNLGILLSTTNNLASKVTCFSIVLHALQFSRLYYLLYLALTLLIFSSVIFQPHSFNTSLLNAYDFLALY